MTTTSLTCHTVKEIADEQANKIDETWTLCQVISRIEKGECDDVVKDDLGEHIETLTDLLEDLSTITSKLQNLSRSE